MKIDIPEDCSTINVLISGGVDSALLLYLLAEQNTKNVPIRCFSMLKSKTEHYVYNVVNSIENYLSIKIYVQFTQRSFYIRDFVESILLISDPHSYVFSGCNKVVDGYFIPTKYIPFDTPPVRGDPLNEYHIRPFISLDKIELCKIYKEKNLQELFLKTHSCGTEIYTHCGECYFCKEKEWGMKSAGLFDI